MTSEKADTRRRYSAAKKAQVLAECREPGTSVAKVAMAHGINTNVVHRWRQMAREGGKPEPFGGTGVSVRQTRLDADEVSAIS